MVETNKEYIEYLKSIDNKIIKESISNYNDNTITFDDLESTAIDNLYLSKFNYFKTFKIGNILNKNK